MIQHQNIHTVAAAGVPWATILQWISANGLPTLLKALSVIVPLLGAVQLPPTQLVAWIEAALKALSDGTPIPVVPPAA